MTNLDKKILTDIRVDLTEAFSENFRRKAFFDKKWPGKKQGNDSRLLLQRGNLMRSIRGTVKGNSVEFTSSLPYASIHNEGGEIRVTAKMKRFFWAKHLECTGKIKGSKSQQRYSEEAQMYKAMALKKVGSVITIPQRQFVGDHPEVRRMVEAIIVENLNEYFQNLKTP